MAKLKLLTFLLPLYLLACAGDNPGPASRSDFIAGNDSFGKTWQISQIVVPLGTLQPHKCVSDNFITYFPNGKYEVNEGASKCSPDDPPSKTGRWEMDRTQNKLTIHIGDSTQVWNIDEVSQTRHKITSRFVEGTRTYILKSN